MIVYMKKIDNKHSYNDIAFKWHQYRHNRPLNKCVIEIVAMLAKGANILDIGCGSGYPIDVYLDNSGFTVTAVDAAEKMIAIAKDLALSNVCFLVSDIMEYEDKERYDLVIAFDVLWHLEKTDQEAIYPKICQWIRPGGYFFFTYGLKDDDTSGEMFGRSFTYHSVGRDRIIKILESLDMIIVKEWIDYHEETTGYRELMILARKKTV